ncbi:WD40 repeat domain-containing protein [Bacterioplanoides sp.]|uniref:WD40 repeat domain-containing protein n=1 Tax=Bacterioplanoides sp. TaxID=2066072 RepID=UPI003AFF6459
MSLLTRSLILASAFLLSACDDAKAPEKIEEVAVQGSYSIRFSADGNQAMVGSLHHGGSLWTLAPLERRYDWNHQAEGYSNILTSAFSPDGNFIATADNRTIVLWDNNSGEAVWFWNAPGDIEDIALTADGNLALLAMQDYTATLFDIKNGGIRQRLAHDGIVYDVSIAEDGVLAASASDDSSARIWNLDTGKSLHTLPHENQVRTVELSTDGRLLFTSAFGESGKIWDARSGTLLREIAALRGHYSSARFVNGGSQLITGNSSGQIELWNVNNGERQQVWRAEPRDTWVSNNVQVEDVARSNGGWVAAGSNGLVYYLK